MHWETFSGSLKMGKGVQNKFFIATHGNFKLDVVNNYILRVKTFGGWSGPPLATFVCINNIPI